MLRSLTTSCMALSQETPLKRNIHRVSVCVHQNDLRTSRDNGDDQSFFNDHSNVLNLSVAKGNTVTLFGLPFPPKRSDQGWGKSSLMNSKKPWRNKAAGFYFVTRRCGREMYIISFTTMTDRSSPLYLYLYCIQQADNLPARGFFERQGFSNIEVSNGIVIIIPLSCLK